MLIDGQHEIAVASASGIRLQRLFVPAEQLAAAETVVRSWAGSELLEIQPLLGRAMERVAYGQRGKGWVAVAEQPRVRLDGIDLGPEPLVLVLDRIEKPGNIGACARTAVACGVGAVLVTDPICDVFNPNAVRASRGAIFAVPIVPTTVAEAASFLAQRGIVPHCARVEAPLGLWECDLRQPVAICIGNETRGLGDRWRDARAIDYCIPMRPPVDSLNASITAAVSLYECARQRQVGRSGGLGVR
ncbi:MAG: RNA methyltransferase [Planctomycetota bacterium]|nr:MAG: RNA methyltransferase [Planctomycetota bacterium]